jgi:hypothetical protein
VEHGIDFADSTIESSESSLIVDFAISVTPFTYWSLHVYWSIALIPLVEFDPKPYSKPGLVLWRSMNWFYRFDQ